MKSLFATAAIAASFMLASCGEPSVPERATTKFNYRYDHTSDSIAVDAKIDSATFWIDDQEGEITEYFGNQKVTYHFVVTSKDPKNIIIKTLGQGAWDLFKLSIDNKSVVISNWSGSYFRKTYSK